MLNIEQSDEEDVKFALAFDRKYVDLTIYESINVSVQYETGITKHAGWELDVERNYLIVYFFTRKYSSCSLLLFIYFDNKIFEKCPFFVKVDNRNNLKHQLMDSSQLRPQKQYSETGRICLVDFSLINNIKNQAEASSNILTKCISASLYIPGNKISSEKIDFKSDLLVYYNEQEEMFEKNIYKIYIRVLKNIEVELTVSFYCNNKLSFSCDEIEENVITVSFSSESAGDIIFELLSKNKNKLIYSKQLKINKMPSFVSSENKLLRVVSKVNNNMNDLNITLEQNGYRSVIRSNDTQIVGDDEVNITQNSKYADTLEDKNHILTWYKNINPSRYITAGGRFLEKSCTEELNWCQIMVSQENADVKIYMNLPNQVYKVKHQSDNFVFIVPNKFLFSISNTNASSEKTISIF